MSVDHSSYRTNIHSVHVVTSMDVVTKINHLKKLCWSPIPFRVRTSRNPYFFPEAFWSRPDQSLQLERTYTNMRIDPERFRPTYTMSCRTCFFTLSILCHAFKHQSLQPIYFQAAQVSGSYPSFRFNQSQEHQPKPCLIWERQPFPANISQRRVLAD